MKPLFGPTWRELLYEEAMGVILATLLYWSSSTLQFDVLSFLGEALLHYLQIVIVEFLLQFHWCTSFFGKSHEP